MANDLSKKASCKIELFLLVALLILSFKIFAQSDNPIVQRSNYKLRLVVNKDSVYEYNIKESPFILKDNFIQLYPTETILVEVDEANNLIRSMKVVQKNMHPNKTIQISFIQNSQNDIHQNMTLQISNPFTKDLSYSAHILLAASNKWIKTDVMPIKAGISSYEMWPDIITSIVLGDWLFVN